MNTAKARVRAKYPNAYRRKFWRHKRNADGLIVPTTVHEILRPISIASVSLGEGPTPREAWEAAQANLLAEALTL